MTVKVGMMWRDVSVTAIACLMASHSAAADDVHIWIRAFIPDTVAGFQDFTQPVTGRAGMFSLRASDGGCLATDRRSWSEGADDSWRLSTDFHLVIDATNAATLRASGDQITSAATVRQIDCTTGADVVATSTQLLADEVSALAPTEKGTQWSVLAAIRDPQRAWSSATVHYDARFHYDRQSHTLAYQASTGVFPAYEAYASLNAGPVMTIFRSGPFRRHVSDGATTTSEATSIDVSGSIILTEGPKRPKAPAHFTVQ